jgi:MFS family permease
VVAEDMRRNLAAGGGLLGLLGSAYFYPYALMQLPAGLLLDSWGLRKTIALFFCVAFAGSVILGLAPGIYLAIVGRTLVGLGVAMLFVPTLKVLAVLILSSIFMLIITGSLDLFTQGISILLLCLICLGIGTFSGAIVTIGFTTNKELFAVSIAGIATGLVNFFPFLGGAVFQVISGALLDSQGLTAAGGFSIQGFKYSFLMLFLCGLTACIASFLLKETMQTRQLNCMLKPDITCPAARFQQSLNI